MLRVKQGTSISVISFTLSSACHKVGLINCLTLLMAGVTQIMVS